MLTDTIATAGPAVTTLATVAPSTLDLAGLLGTGNLFAGLDASTASLATAAHALGTLESALDKVTAKTREERDRVNRLLEKLPTLDSAGQSVNSPFARTLGLDVLADSLQDTRDALKDHVEVLGIIETMAIGQAGLIKDVRDNLLLASQAPPPAEEIAGPSALPVVEKKEEEEEVAHVEPTPPTSETPALVKCEACEMLFTGLPGLCSGCARQDAKKPQPAAAIESEDATGGSPLPDGVPLADIRKDINKNEETKSQGKKPGTGRPRAQRPGTRRSN